MLLSGCNPEIYRDIHTRALPISGPSRPAATLIQTRRDPENGGKVFPAQRKTLRVKIASSQPKAGVDPLYLFVCGLSWRKRSDTNAGWELIRCLNSPGQTSRIASAFLLEECIELPVPARVRAIHGLEKPSPQSEVGFQRSGRRSL
jgi:hypothetical protein